MEANRWFPDSGGVMLDQVFEDEQFVYARSLPRIREYDQIIRILFSILFFIFLQTNAEVGESVIADLHLEKAGKAELA